MALLLVSIVSVVVVTLVEARIFQSAVEADIQRDLTQDCSMIATALEDAPDEVAAAAHIDMGAERLTLVGSDGKVLYDSEQAASTMQNHKSRPEIAQALSQGEGQASRASATLGVMSYYHATRLDSGSVVRVATDRQVALAIIAGNTPVVIVFVIASICACWLAACQLSLAIARPVLRIDPSAGQAKAPYRELEPLVGKLNEQQQSLVKHMDQLRDAEIMRQEFSSNVTHELKTPLASISGAAELMRDGIVRPEDIPNFAGRIYDESQRLTTLVNDILTLSKLDEAERSSSAQIVGTLEPCELSAIVSDVAKRLTTLANSYQVSIKVQTTPTTVIGNARLLDELIYNLAANAVRYNTPLGSVTITCATTDNVQPYIRVADTGIGIAPADQQKIFERFYRVDTSRSREHGGTGLGLAIVKHVAAFHKATIDLESEVGKGTTITITFPPQAKKGMS